MKVPFVDLQAQLAPIRKEIQAGIDKILDKCNFVLGEEVFQFEREFAQYCGSKFALGVASGLDAIHLAVRALDIGAGDEVIVPAHTFVASALGVTMAGATPVFVDVRDDFLLDVSEVEKAITPRTKAILPVHLYGQFMDLGPLLELANRHRIPVIEDAAQAHGALLHSKRAGTVGSIGCFSFYPGKNLGCYGDGGAVVTDSPELKSKLEALRNYGSVRKYHHPVVGFNSRLDTIQSTILSAKLPRLDGYNSARLKNALAYNQALEGVGDLVLPKAPKDGSHIFHLYVLRTQKRDALLKHLNDNGIGAGIHYPVPMHLHGAFAELGYKAGSFPVAEKICSEILSLPMFPELSLEQLQYSVAQLKAFF